MRVEHVHVYDGGQAIVGSVLGAPATTWGDQKSERQPHALVGTATLALPAGSAVLREDTGGDGCLSPAVRGKARCRMHGGSRGVGAPKGKRNGAYRTGLHTDEAIAFRRACRTVLEQARAGLGDLS